MSNVLSFANRPPRQDYIIIGGHKSPGVCEFARPAEQPRNWDIRKGYGYSGAFTVFTGTGLAKFSVLFKLWDDPQTPTTSQWSDWAAFAKAVLTDPIPGMRPKALTIQHPTLSTPPLSITAVVVTNVTSFVQDELGLWTCTVDFLEFRSPVQELGKPDAAIPPLAASLMTANDHYTEAIGLVQKSFLQLPDKK